MEVKELEKIAALAFLYGFGAPVLAICIKGRPNLQRLVFIVMCVMIPGGIYKPQEWGLTLGSLDLNVHFYRGHATGYHFYFVEGFALALIIARALDDWRGFRFLPPGLWLYLLYCALSFLSIVNAPNVNFVCMAAFKAVKMALIFVAGYNFLNSEKDFRLFLLAMTLAIGIQFLAVLRLRYALGVYQVAGTFEHQNSLSMFITMIGMVLLAVTLGPKTRWSNLFLFAYMASAFIQQSTFSRAGLVIFAAGSAGVAGLSIIDRFTARRATILAVLGVVGIAGVIMSLDTIKARFSDYGNEASGMTRKLLNQASRDMAEDYPLGIGWNNFAMAINRPFPYGNIIDEWELEGGVKIDPHHQKGVVESLYYLLLAETGWQGLITFLLWMALYLVWNIRGALAYRYDFRGALSLGIAGGCGCNYLHSTLERVLIQPRNMMLWLLLLAITARIEVWRRQEARLRRVRSGAPRPELSDELQPAAQ
ncbi:MAG: O-antigen ligase family protein [Verrucomicrobiia bacterium]